MLKAELSVSPAPAIRVYVNVSPVLASVELSVPTIVLAVTFSLMELADSEIPVGAVLPPPAATVALMVYVR
jgi:hypothetical protein